MKSSSSSLSLIISSSSSTSSKASSSWLNIENLSFIVDNMPPPVTFEIVEPNLTLGVSDSSSISSSLSSWSSSSLY